MVRRLILDTSLLIASEQNKLDLIAVIGHDDAALAAMTAMELLAGVESWAPDRRGDRALKIEGYVASLPIEAYTLRVARAHVALYHHFCRTGRPRGVHDLIIAATAAATGRTLLTIDKEAGFTNLPGVRAEVVKTI